MVTADRSPASPDLTERAFPPIATVAVFSMALVIVGGIYIASYVPQSVPLAIPIILLIGAAALIAANVVMLSRLHEFAWRVFWQIFRYAQLAYLVIAGMIAYVFITDGTRGGVLVVLLGMLAIFAVDVPTILAFSVARYQDPE